MYERQLCPPFKSRSFMNSYGFTSFTTRAPTCQRSTDNTVPQSTVRGQWATGKRHTKRGKARSKQAQHWYGDGDGAGAGGGHDGGQDSSTMVARIAAPPAADILNMCDSGLRSRKQSKATECIAHPTISSQSSRHCCRLRIATKYKDATILTVFSFER